MSLNGRTRSRAHEAICIQALLAVAALLALLVIRIAPPHFTSQGLHHSSINAISSHDQRPHFDSDGSQWSAPVRHYLPFPPAAESTHLIPTSELCFALQTKGFHYNRPPPAS